MNAGSTRGDGLAIIARIMAPPALALIAAVAKNGVIGANNALPWRLPADLARFKALTLGHTVVMGRRTWESLPRALPGRQNVVVTHHMDYVAAGADVVHSFDEAMRTARMPHPVFCIGGAGLFAETMMRADVLYMTEIDRDFEGDVHFPPFDRRAWRETAREEARSTDGWSYAFVTYERISNGE
jgi:dihydrofolate reductase